MYHEDESKLTFEEALTNLINRYSMENGSNTPDYILAKYLCECLDNYDNIVRTREMWWGRSWVPKLSAGRIVETL